MREEITAHLCDRYKKRFHKFDKESKGFITTVDVQQVLEVSRLSVCLLSLYACLHYMLLISALVFLLCRASMSTLMKMRSMKSLMRWTSTRTDKLKLMNSCRWVTCRQWMLSEDREARHEGIWSSHTFVFYIFCERFPQIKMNIF